MYFVFFTIQEKTHTAKHRRQQNRQTEDSTTHSKTEGRTRSAKDKIFSTFIYAQNAHTKAAQKSRTEDGKAAQHEMALMPLWKRTHSTHTDRQTRSRQHKRGAACVACYPIHGSREASEANTDSAEAQKRKEGKTMKKQTAQKDVNAQKKQTAQTEGRKGKDMKKKTQKKDSGAAFDINAHNNKMIIEHTDGSREAVTAEDMKKKSADRYSAEKVATLRKWATARGIDGTDKMKKSALVAALVEDDAKPKEEKEAAKTARKEAAQKKDAEAKKEAAAPKKEKKEKKPKKEKKDGAKKKEDAPQMDSVKTSLEKEDARIVCAMDVQNMQNVDIADALNRIKTLKLYEVKGADSMKDFVENYSDNPLRVSKDGKAKSGGKYHGMTYSHVNKYINAHNYVYSMKEKDGSIIFAAYGWHLIQALISPCRHHSEAVREAVKDKRITASMSLKSLNALIETEGWKKEKKEAANGAQKTEAEAAEDATEEAATASTLPKTEKHNGITDEAAEEAAAILSAFIDEADAPKEKKEAAEKALGILQKRADI